MTDAAAAEAPDPAILRAEQRLRMLRELAEIAARALHRQALAAADPAEVVAPTDPSDTPVQDTSGTSARRAPTPVTPAGDPAGAFARLSRAIRLTLALEARTDEALRALSAGVVAEREARRVAARNRAADEAMARREAREETVERLVFEAAEREIEDEEALNDVLAALEERLEQDEAYQDLERAPLRETVERLCADLQLTPDWNRWEGEGWTPQEPFFRPRASIWRRPSSKPILPSDSGSQSAAFPAPRAHALE
jgi:hypothetical protein